MKLLLRTMLFAAVAIMASCGKSDPDDGGKIGPNEKVDDPEGTVELCMRNGNNGETRLDSYIYISKADNFRVSGGKIASIGAVRGLGNVSEIPLSGWSDEVAVTPGNGYVAYCGNNDTYYRIYVESYVESVAGGIIGANVKYQKPFKGLKQKIEPDVASVVLDPNPSSEVGTTQQVIFKNNSIIPFTVKSSENWCIVNKASTRDETFLYDAIVISTGDLYSADKKEATVTVTNLFGESSEIKVVRPGRGVYIESSVTNVEFNCSENEQSKNVGIFTNAEPSAIQVSSDVDWLSATVENSFYKPERKVRSIEGRITRATLDNPSERNLRVKCAGYMGGENRRGTITLTCEQATAKLTVTQNGSGFSISQPVVELGGIDNLEKEISYNRGNLDINRMSCTYENDADKWVTLSFDRYNIRVKAQANPLEKQREATVKIAYEGGKGDKYTLGILTVRQGGAKYEDQKVFFQSTASNYSLVFPVQNDAKITSSADWCTATPNGGNLIIRASSTTTNRSAVITIEGISAKIYVSQSKYKVGDNYSVNGVDGKIYSMENGIGKICKDLNTKAAWSTENVDLQGAASMDDGKANMASVMTVPGWKELYPAFAAVNELNTNGVIGWYLPAVKELQSIKNFNFSNRNYYWSSTNSDKSNAYCCFSYISSIESTYTISKNTPYYIVAINTFSYDFSNTAK